MKKFVSILTVVAMVAALSTSAFAANSTTSPLDPGEVVEYGPGDFNDPSNGDVEAPAETPATPPAETPAAPPAGETPVAPPAETPAAPPADETPVAPPAAEVPATPAAESASPTAKVEDYTKDTLAYSLVSLLLDTVNVVTSDELVEKMGVKAPFKFTIASNPLAMKNAKGVKIEKLENGKTRVTVGQNQVTEGKKAEDLFALVAPNKAGEKAEVCEITLDEPGNMVFETNIEVGAFCIGLKAE